MTTTVLRSEALNRSSHFSFAQFLSTRGAVGALAMLLALPITIVYGIFFPAGAESVIHFMLAIGTFLIGLSVFDFGTPSWVKTMTCVAASALAAIFLAQGLASLTANETLTSIAYSRELGGWAEAITISTVMAWFVAIARTHTRGATMVLGVVSPVLVIGLSVWSMIGAAPSGMPQELRLLFLLPIAWFLFVTTRRPSTN